jgi:hypothetical protein
VALRLKRNGIARVRPLEGGLGLWKDSQFPIDDLKPDVGPDRVADAGGLR